MMWVRSPSPAPLDGRACNREGYGPHSSGVEHFLGKEEVPGSNPGVGSRLNGWNWFLKLVFNRLVFIFFDSLI